MIAPKLYPFYSLLWAYDIWFTPSSSGLQLGHKTRPGHCNMQYWRINSDWFCMCVYWSLSFSTLFQGDLLAHLHSLYSILASALCSWVPCWGTWEHKALAWVGYKLLKWGQQFAMWGALLQVSWLFSRLGRTLSESWMALQWGGRVPGVWT